MFDLETDTVWMTQAANCGSTPAALSRASDLSGVTGQCGAAVSAAEEGNQQEGETLPGFVGSGSGSATGSVNGMASGTANVGAGRAASLAPAAARRRKSAQSVLLWALGVVAALQIPI